MSVRPAARRKRVLVIGHDAYRAGSQVCLLHLLRWLVGNYPADFSLLLRRGGEMLGAYEEVLETKVVPAAPGGEGWRSILLRVARRALKRRRRLVPASEPIDLIYANSVPSLGIAMELAAARNCPVICHIHELDLAIHRFFAFEEFREVLQRVDRIVAVSEAVATNLVNSHGVDPGKIHLIYEAIAQPVPRLDPKRCGEMRETIGIPPDAFIVGGCGTMDLRKAPEVFVQIARCLSDGATPRPVHFVWVGGQTAGWEREVLAHDIARMGLGEMVHFVGPQAEPAKYFSLFDVLMLTSREDPFPLVCLEAAALGVPTICFADAGGISEFVRSDAGFVVPYLDVARASECIRLLMGSEALRLRLGRCAAERVKEHDVARIGPQIAAVIDTYLRAIV